MTPWTDIQGWLTEAEGAELQRLAADRTCLNVGVWKGRSVVAMASTAKHVICIDHFKGDAFTGKAFTLPDFVRTLDEHECRDRITVIVGDQRYALPMLQPSRFDFVFYDADHTGPETEYALAWCANRAPWAIVAVHDYSLQPQYADAVSVVDRFAQTQRRTLRTVGTLAILEPSR